MNTKTPIDLEALKRDILRRRLLATAVPTRQLDAIPFADRNEVIPLSSAQQRLWFIDQLDHAGSSAYHMPAGLQFRGAMDVVALQSALGRIVARHENLRTTFANVGGSPRQIILPEGSGFSLIEHDLSTLPEEVQADALQALIDQEIRAPFDLSSGPLVRGRLLRLADDDHVLVLTMHHIVSDGWSLGVMVKEFSALYTAFVQGQPDPLPPLPIQYADYAVWQRGWLRGEVLERQLSFWRAHLTGAPALLELPTDRPRPAVQSYAGGAVQLELSTELVQGLRLLAKRHGATAFMTLLAAWSVLLSRLSGQSDIVVGTPAANRQRQQLAPLTGFFVNTLALRTNLEGDPSVAELISQVKNAALEAYANQETPIEHIFDALQPVRSMSHSTLFQTMLAYNNTPGGMLDLPGLSLSVLEMPHHTSRFDMTLAFTEIDDRLSGGLEYASDLFDASTIERWLEYWQRILAAMVADDTQRVSELALLDQAERYELLDTFNATAADYARETLIHGTFEARVALTPEAIAVEQDGEQISYAQLNARANRLAHYLMSLGVKADDRVAICIERSIEMLVGLLGILKAGGAYVPLDPAYPTARLTYMLSDCGPVALVTQARLRESISEWAASTVPLVILDIEERAPHWELQPENDPNPKDQGLTSAHLAYVIYTSGSTGQPKGVMVEHRNVANLVAAHAGRCELTHRDRVLQFSSVSFDASVEEIFPVLSAGAVVVLRPAQVAPDQNFSRLLLEQRITVVELPTAFWHQWVRSDQFESCLSETMVRLVVIGGEQADPQAFAAWLTGCRSRPCHLLNTYGPTEATVYASAITLDNALPLKVVPIGKPIENVKIYVLDARLEPVPLGVVGEIYIGGAQVARGYLNRPELTRERFIANPFDSSHDALMYRTGDLGRWREGGCLDYLGRNDHQVKIRGFRIELGEVEAQLQRLPDVRAAVVLVREDVPGERRLVAYIVAPDDKAPTAARLRELLADQLPEHMLPSAIVSLGALPHTPNGKIDRAALPAPDDASVARRDYEAPLGEIEQALAQIWQDLLHLERVGRHDHFFELGGHSLMAVQVVARLHQQLGIELPLHDLFAQPTLAALAQVALCNGNTRQPTLMRADRGSVLPLSWAQQRLWFLDQLDSAAGGAYHISTALRLHGRLDCVALKAALDRVVLRHESLRTTFASEPESGTARQQIAPEDTGCSLAWEDLSALAGEAQESLLHQHGREVAQAPFDLEKGPLLRGRLLRLAPDDHVLLVAMHHIVADGWSMGVLISEVGALYAAYATGGPDPLPPLPIQYADYALWQREWLQGEVREQQLDYWRGHLAGAPALLELPTDRPRPAQQSYRGASIGFELGSELTTHLKRAAEAHGVTLFMLLYAGWSLLLSRLSGQADVVVGVPVANRRRVEVEGLIGFFVNTVALRLRVDDALSVKELLARVRELTLGGFEHQDLPFEQVVEALNPLRSLGHSPVFQNLLALQNTPTDAVELLGLRLSAQAVDPVTAQFDVSLLMHENGDQLCGSLNYASDLFDAATMQRWVGHLQVLLHALTGDPRQQVAALPWLDAVQRRTLLQDFAAPRVMFPIDSLIHQRFEAQVACAPDAVAVEYEAQSLTYAQLDARANQWAHRLCAAGVGPDRLVGLCVERGLDLVIGVLAILKAGGAYLPLDPAYPRQRLAYLLEDAAPVLVLVQAACLAALPDSAVPVLVLDAATVADQPSYGPVVRELSATHLAYVIYTSGSTGQPKGVMVEHAQVMRLFASTESAFDFGADDIWTLFHSFAFDFSVWELWGALLHGGRLVVVPQLTTRSPTAFYRLLCERGVTVLNQTPTAFSQLITAQAELAASAETLPPHRLKWVVFGGEALSLQALQPWVARNGDTAPALVNMYGITETTVHVTHCRLTAAQIDGEPASLVGRALPDLGIYVLDGRGEPVPPGVTGELFVGGAGVARGYLHRPQLTAERFIANPFADAAMPRLYRTGDLGRWRADGTLDYLGRNDDQVKIRGFRIEPGEIARELRGLAGVADVVVLAREDVPGEKRLVAYVVAEPDTTLVPAELRGALAARLADHLVPAAFVLLERLPLTGNGKLDRTALPAPDGASMTGREYEAPVGEIEQVLAQVWENLLGVERVGRRDHFFELGGHSLLAVQLIQKLRQRGLSAEVRAVFVANDLAELALATHSIQDVNVPANAITADCTVIAPDMLPLIDLSQADIDSIVGQVPGGVANIQDIYSLTPLQDGILFHHLLDPRLDPYLIVGRMEFRSRAVLDGFLSAVQLVVDRHDILRTAFIGQGIGTPAQVVWRRAQLAITEVAVDFAGGSAWEQLARQFDSGQYRLDLATAPLLRFYIAREPNSDRWLVLQLHHHLIDDASSLGILNAEVRAILAGRGHELPPPPPFRNLIARIRFGMPQEEHERFFRRMLADVSEPTQPFGLHDVRHDGTNVDEAHRVLTPALNDELRAHARRIGVSVASLFHVAWGLVMARASQREQAVFGTVLFGRMADGADRAVGLFVNTLPFRFDADDSGVVDSARNAHAQLGDLLRHEHASLALAQRCSGVPRQEPLFSALLNFRHGAAPAADSRDDDAASSGIEWLGGQERTNYPLTLSVDDFGEAFCLTVHAVKSVDAGRICDFVQKSLEQIVTALERAPRTPVRALDVLPPSERELLLDTWNRTEAAFPSERCAHELFERQASERPNAIAIIQGDQSLTYSELDARANRLAHCLIERGVKPDDRVSICAERSLAMVVAQLAVLKAGGAYVPLDPSHPEERLTQLLIDCNPKLLLMDAAGRQALGDAAALVSGRVDLSAACAEYAGHRSDDPDARARGLTSRHLAYVIYTSGSTGTPKGVMVEHRQLVNLTTWHASRIQLEPGSRSAATASVAFDASVWEIWSALCNGGTLLLPPEASVDAMSMLRWWAGQPLDASFLTTPLATLALNEGLVNPGLRYLLIGGERLPHVPASLPDGLVLINNYGPTETTVVATSCQLSVDDAVVPIGRPIANARIYLLDSRSEPVPLGAVGEIHIGGAGVARGYLDRPELTAERFLADPFSRVAHARMYRTGDLARYRSDGNLEFLGRNDQQIKIRGFRIEPGEVEARLSEHPAVRNAVVVAREDRPGDVRLVAYVVVDAASAITVSALRAHLAGCLPEYMVPAAVVSLNELPLTPNGKIDRKALPAPEGDAFIRQGYAAPEGETELALARLWSDLLGIERIGRHDNFFELGGHSLLAIRLLSRLPQTFGVELPLAALFTHTTLAALAAVVAASTPDAGQAVSPIEAVSREAPLPLSYAQQRLWFLAQFDGGSAAYHIPLALRLRGALDSAAWIGSLNALYARHEALRTVFVGDDGGPQAELLSADSGLPLVEHDLRGRADAAEQLEALCREEVGAAFDLARGPLIRGRLVRLAEDDHVFLLTQHHIVSDGWSLGVMARELAALYTAFAQGEANPLPPLTVQYPDYAAWQRQWLAGERLQAQTDYWSRALADAPVRLELPTDRPRPPQQSFAGASVPVHLSAELTRDLKQLSQAQGVTLFMTLLAAWATVLARLSGQNDLIIGSPTANRGRRELEPLIGFFVNTLALRIDLSGAPSGAELLARVRRVALEAQENQDLPFEQVVEIAQPPRHLEHTPLFQTMFAWQNNEASIAELPGLSLEAAEVPLDTVKFDLELSLGEADGAIVGGLSYASALFDGATIERYRRYLLAALQALVDDVDQPVARIDLLPAAERAVLLDDWNHAVTHPVETCIHQLFEQQARQRPEAIAVEYDGQSLDYAELNAQANRLAHCLIERGVKPDDRVAICVERSLAMVVGVLAILKAGGAYVPLDPSYPAERLTQLLNDCAPHLLLSDAAGRQALGDAATQAASGHVDLDRVSDECAGYRSDDPDPRAHGLTPRHLAYIIYTSGSTGTPKGVMVEHAQVVRLFEATRGEYDFDETDTWCLFHSFAFDFSVWEMWGAWRYGGRLLIVPRDVARSADDFHRLAHTAGVTVLNQTPSAFRGFIEASSRAGLKSALRYVILGGEALEPAMLKAWYALHPDSSPRLVNMYGITETTVHVTFHALEESDCAQRGSPIGRPIPDLRIYLLDPLGQPVPLGAVGEIHVGGAGVARGYLNRPELTAARFVDDPFSTVAGARMYRSGDLARYLPDGRLEFFGRNDQQIKIRGFRIELGEIEARLAEHAWVKEAVVRAVEDDAGDKRLTAYFVLQDGVDADEPVNRLRDYLAQRLPDYMVPAAYVPLPGIPLTTHGKLDTGALPGPDGTAFARRQYEAPRTAREEILCDVWSEMLQVERVGVNDNFFEIGGDSILSLKIVRQARARGLEISVTDIFAHQTVAGLAEVARHFADDRRIDVDALRLGEELRRALPPTVEDAYPLTAMQTLMVDEYDRNREHGLGIYHVQQYFEFKDVRPCADAMHEALKLLVAAHPIFRTTLMRVGAATVQGIASEDAFTFEFVDEDLRACSEAETEARVRDYVVRDRQRAFADAALLRFAWFRTANDMFVLVHSIHHAIDDGWGNQQFLNQLFQTYISLRNGGTPSVERADNVFREYVALQLELAGSVEAQAFWASRRYRPCGVDTLQRHYGRPQNRYGSMMTIDSKTTGKLRAAAKRLGVSLRAVLLGAYLETIKSWACVGSPMVGVIVNGRSDRLSDPLGSLGLFWNMLPFGHDGWIADRSERLRATQRELLDMERYAAFPLSSIEEIRGSPGLFFATFNYVDFHNAGSLPANEGIELTRVYGHDKFHYPLNYAFSVDRSNGDIGVHIQYDDAYFDGRDVHALNVTLLDLLEDFGAR